MERSHAYAWFAGTLLAATLLGLLVAWAAAAQADEDPLESSIPTVEGPITGPGDRFIGFRPGPDGTNPEDFDYITEEFFVSGTAGPDQESYEVRMVIRRPAKPNKFSGTVVAEPTHRGGNALICNFGRYGILQRGHVCVDVMARPINLDNFGNPATSLHPFNFERYGHLHVEGNQTNEILAQVGQMLKSDHENSPLASAYPVDTIVLSGTSDSSGAARSYMGSGHPSFRMPDGSPVYDGFFVSATLGGNPVQTTDVPTIQMPTQSEVHSTDAYRRPDSDEPGNQFRIYEVAGMSHNDGRENPQFQQPPHNGCDNEISQFPYGAMTFLGLQHVIDWTDGVTPPRADYIEVDGEGPTRVALDEFGNAMGGVRSTYLDVPTHTHTIPNSGPLLCSQTGFETPLEDDVLDDLYRNRGGYVSSVNVRLMELIRQGWFPPEYARDYVRADMKEFISEW